MRVLSIGEILWDVFGDGERLGGAPLNVAIHAARLGHDAAILSGVGEDRRGAAALRAVRDAGVSDRWITRTGLRPTGTAEVALDPSGNPSFDIARPAAFDETRVDPATLDAIVAWQPDWIVFGTLAQTRAEMRGTTESVIASCVGAERLYDINLRPGDSPEALVVSLISQATVVKANADEAEWLARNLDVDGGSPGGEGWLAAFVGRFGLRGVCVTRGAGGAELLLDGAFARADAPAASAIDTVGAGDAFSAALIHGIGAAWRPERIVATATRLGSLVAMRQGATPPWSPEEIDGLT